MNIKLSYLQNYKYALPSNKKQLISDFYVYTFISKIQSNSNSNFQEFRDNTNISELLKDIRDKLIVYIKKEMLNAVYIACSAEFYHIIDHMEVPKLDKNTQDFFNLYVNKSIDYDFILKHIEDSDPSYKSRFEFLKSLSLDKNNNLNPEKFMIYCKKIFNKGKWDRSYGGKAWGKIADSWFLLKNAKTENEQIIYIDHIIDLQHNSGSIFSKITSYEQFNINKDFFDKKSSLGLFFLINNCSVTMKKISSYILNALGYGSLESLNKEFIKCEDIEHKMSLLAIRPQLDLEYIKNNEFLKEKLKKENILSGSFPTYYLKENILDYIIEVFTTTETLTKSEIFQYGIKIFLGYSYLYYADDLPYFAQVFKDYFDKALRKKICLTLIRGHKITILDKILQIFNCKLTDIIPEKHLVELMLENINDDIIAKYLTITPDNFVKKYKQILILKYGKFTDLPYFINSFFSLQNYFGEEYINNEDIQNFFISKIIEILSIHSSNIFALFNMIFRQCTQAFRNKILNDEKLLNFLVENYSLRIMCAEPQLNIITKYVDFLLLFPNFKKNFLKDFFVKNLLFKKINEGFLNSFHLEYSMNFLKEYNYFPGCIDSILEEFFTMIIREKDSKYMDKSFKMVSNAKNSMLLMYLYKHKELAREYLETYLTHKYIMNDSENKRLVVNFSKQFFTEEEIEKLVNNNESNNSIEPQFSDWYSSFKNKPKETV